MTKVEIDGKTYCVETLIYTVERLTKDVKASAEYHRLVLEQIRDEIEQARFIDKNTRICKNALASGLEAALQIIDKYKGNKQ